MKAPEPDREGNGSEHRSSEFEFYPSDGLADADAGADTKRKIILNELNDDDVVPDLAAESDDVVPSALTRSYNVFLKT